MARPDLKNRPAMMCWMPSSGCLDATATARCRSPMWQPKQASAKGTVYLFFPSKEELVLSAIDRIAERLHRRNAGHRRRAG